MSNQFIRFRNRNCEYRIPTESIIYVQVMDAFILIYTLGARYQIRCRLKELLSSPECDCLVQVHRSFAVHPDKVISISHNEIGLGHVTLPLGKTFSKTLRDWFLNDS